MKRVVCLLIALILLTGLIAGCSQEEEVQLGSLNAPAQILKELIVGDIEGSLAPFRGDVRTPELTEKMTEYASLLNGRDYLRCECLDYEVTGTRMGGIYEETTYHKITLNDDTVLYAICYSLKDDEWDGLVSFDLYTECPWQ